MNLGAIYIDAALVILAAGLLAGAVATGAFLLATRTRVFVSTLLLGTFAIGLPSGCAGLALFHGSLFRAWHQHQNEALPASDCLTYEPSFWHLYATYAMDQQSFDQWIDSHPWSLTRCEPDEIFRSHDGPHFGLTSCEAVYESPRGPKGNNLRVYYQNGTAYISYNAM
jgi:hypothetical protein